MVTEGVDTQHITVKSADGYGVPVRIYNRSNAGSNLPMLVYFHGGGFFGGGPDIMEQMCKVLVRDLDCVVLKTIHILHFTDLQNIRPIYYDKTYHAVPEQGGDKAFELLRRAMKEENKVAVAKTGRGLRFLNWLRLRIWKESLQNGRTAGIIVISGQRTGLSANS